MVVVGLGVTDIAGMAWNRPGKEEGPIRQLKKDRSHISEGEKWLVSDCDRKTEKVKNTSRVLQD